MEKENITSGNVYIIYEAERKHEEFAAVCFPEDRQPVIIELYRDSSNRENPIVTNVFPSIGAFEEDINQAKKKKRKEANMMEAERILMITATIIVPIALIALVIFLIVKAKKKKKSAEQK